MIRMFVKPDMTGWSDAKRGAFYMANEDHLDEIFNDGVQEFFFDPDGTITTRDGLAMTLREASAYDAKKRWLAEHPGARALAMA